VDAFVHIASGEKVHNATRLLDSLQLVHQDRNIKVTAHKHVTLITRKGGQVFALACKGQFLG
jgi:hypothetical protein